MTRNLKQQKSKQQKSKHGIAESHVVQGDPMFSKAWSHGIVTGIPDKSTMYFKLPTGKTVVRSNVLKVKPPSKQ